MTPENAHFFNLKDALGAIVSQVSPGSPAANAGLKNGDVITSLNGRPIENGGGLPLRDWATATVAHINFSETLLDGMLSFMLFAGALHVDLAELREQKATVAILATVGVLLSTVLVGFSTWIVFRLFGLPLPIVGCLTFGALISPTDPIAVMGLLKAINAPKSLSTKIAGEPLFNDGVGIVIFLLILRMWAGSEAFDWAHTLILLLREVGGGFAMGLLLGYLCCRLLRSIDNYQVEVMLTLAFVSGGYQLANFPAHQRSSRYCDGWHLHRKLRQSADHDGNHSHASGRVLGDDRRDLKWCAICPDWLQVLVLTLQHGYLSAALASIPLVLAARFLSLASPLFAMKIFRGVETPISILTWGGLRWGLSIAMALSLPPCQAREIIVICTYAVVAFAILVQATTMPWLLRKVLTIESP